jgi:hypothetical protein
LEIYGSTKDGRLIKMSIHEHLCQNQYLIGIAISFMPTVSVGTYHPITAAPEISGLAGV